MDATKLMATTGWRANAGIAIASMFAGAIVAANIHWTLRPYIVLVCMIVGPGWAIGGLVDVGDRMIGAVIGCALGLSVDILVALAIAELGGWHPEAAAVVILEVSAAILLVRAARVRRRGVRRSSP